MSECKQCQGAGRTNNGALCPTCRGTGAVPNVAPGVSSATKVTRGIGLFVAGMLGLGWFLAGQFGFEQSWHPFALAAVPAAILAIYARWLIGLAAIGGLAYLLLQGMFT